MADNITAKFLSFKDRFHMFNGMNNADVLSITKNIKFKQFAPGELLIQENTYGQEIFYTLRGECNIVSNRKIIGSFKEGTLIGEVASMTGGKRSASVRAQTQVSVFIFEVNFLKEDKVPTAFVKYYKNIALEVIGKLKNSNAKSIHK